MKRDEATLRMLAVQLAAQLPEDPQDAFRVIELCRELCLKFLHPEERPPKPLRLA